MHSFHPAMHRITLSVTLHGVYPWKGPQYHTYFTLSDETKALPINTSLKILKHATSSDATNLNHRGWVMHICINNLTIIGSDNALSPGGRQAIVWTNAGILIIGPLGTNISEIWIWIPIFSFKKMCSKMWSGKWRPCCLGFNVLNHWGWVTHICISNLTIIGSDNALSPGRCQAIIWINAGILLTGPLGTNFSEILIAIQTFSLKKIHLKLLPEKRQPFCLGLNVLRMLEIPCNLLPTSVTQVGATTEKSQPFIVTNVQKTYMTWRWSQMMYVSYHEN